jgi:hypothetical protein
MTARGADALGRQVATAVADRFPEADSLTWGARAPGSVVAFPMSS